MIEVIKTVKTLINSGLIGGVITHEDQLKFEGLEDASEWVSTVRHIGARSTSIQVMLRVRTIKRTSELRCALRRKN